VGRTALERHAASPRRTEVTLVWDLDDVTAIMRSEGPADLISGVLGLRFD
jgi:hypothetical protein